MPLIVGAGEWAGLARGLTQRAELFDRLQADLYGPRDLLRRAKLGEIGSCLEVAIFFEQQLGMHLSRVVQRAIDHALRHACKQK